MNSKPLCAMSMDSSNYSWTLPHCLLCLVWIMSTHPVIVSTVGTYSSSRSSSSGDYGCLATFIPCNNASNGVHRNAIFKWMVLSLWKMTIHHLCYGYWPESSPYIQVPMTTWCELSPSAQSTPLTRYPSLNFLSYPLNLRKSKLPKRLFCHWRSRQAKLINY